jgi:hypothetical protein
VSAYFVLKVIHILSATILAGTGFGIAFFKWIVDLRSAGHANRREVSSLFANLVLARRTRVCLRRRDLLADGGQAVGAEFKPIGPAWAIEFTFSERFH